MDWQGIESAPKDGTWVWVKRVFELHKIAEGWAVWGANSDDAPMRQWSDNGRYGVEPPDNDYANTKRWLTEDRRYSFPTPTHWTQFPPGTPDTAMMQHWSDCAVHNEPALPAGACNCGGLPPTTAEQAARVCEALCDGGPGDDKLTAAAKAIQDGAWDSQGAREERAMTSFAGRDDPLRHLQLTVEQIDANRTPRGAWTRATLNEWGVPWPPPRGWRQALIKGRPIPRRKEG